MAYERSQRIEQRFVRTLELIREGRGSSADLSTALDVSRPTVHRIIAELKRRGHYVRSVREGTGWHYEILHNSSADESEARK